MWRWCAANLPANRAPLVRVHSHCLTGDVLASTACDCNEIIDRSLAAIAREERGVFVYLHHTGRGFRIDSGGEEGALPAILVHERGEIDRDLNRQRLIQRESGIGAQILIDLGLQRIRVLTNHPKKVVALEGYGLEIADQVALGVGAARANRTRRFSGSDDGARLRQAGISRCFQMGRSWVFESGGTILT